MNMQGKRLEMTASTAKIAGHDPQLVGTSHPSFSNSFKDEMLLLSFLVMFVGIVSTDAYYSAFGVRYQFLGFSSWQVLYRGVTSIVDAPYLLAPYLAAVIWICWQRREPEWQSLPRLRGFCSYLVVFSLLALSYYLAKWEGTLLAKADMDEQATTLPHIVSMTRKNGIELKADDGYVLFMTDANYHLIFVPMQCKPQCLPYVERIPKDEVLYCMYGNRSEPVEFLRGVGAADSLIKRFLRWSRLLPAADVASQPIPRPGTS